MCKIPDIKPLEIYYENNFIDSELVEIPKDSGINIDMQYPKMNFKNALNKSLIRKEVLEKLLLAKSYLPENITFKIWDAYRPLSLQKELYEFYKAKIIKEFNLEKKPKEEQEKIISRYVSVPVEDEKLPPLHTTGGAIDLTLVDKYTNKELDMGTEFDSFKPSTSTNFFEQTNNEKVKNNRRILYNAMTKAGFTNLPSEWWHYDYKDRAWAYYKEKPAEYKGIFSL